MELIDRIIQQNPWWEGKEIHEIKNFKKRKLFFKILEYIETKQIISMVGLRRVGKSTLLFQIIEELLKKTESKKILYFSFDELLGKDPLIIEKILEIYEQEILKENLKEVFVFFDEVNHVNDWQVILKRYYDSWNIKFFVSGSAGIFLKKSKESLAGRIYEFELKPLSFEEYLYMKDIRIKDLNLNKTEIRRELNNYFQNGAFPEIINEKNYEKISAYIKSIIEKIIFYDIPKVYDVGEPLILKEIFDLIAKNPGSIVEYTNFASTLKITYQTVSKYIDYLEKSFLIKTLYNYRGSPIARKRKSKKIYLSNLSLAIPFVSENEFLKIIPKLIENLVVNHLNAEFFWREYYEIDIFHKNTPVEVKYREDPNAKGSIEASRKLNSKKLLIITKDFESIAKKDKLEIRYIPLWKFLLSKEKFWD